MKNTKREVKKECISSPNCSHNTNRRDFNKPCSIGFPLINKREVKKQIADYVWLEKTQRSWHIWIGNPLCIGLYKIPLKEKTEAEIIKLAKRENEKERKRFIKTFPNMKWKTLT